MMHLNNCNEWRRCVSAQDLWKLEILVRQEDIEAVLLFVGRIGVAHSVDVKCEIESYEGFLEEYIVPCEITNQYTDLLARVNRRLEQLELKPEELTEKPPLPAETTLKGILAEMEERLSKIEHHSNPFVETINVASTLTRKIDQKLKLLKISPKKPVIRSNTSFSEKFLQKMLSDAEQSLCDIESRLEEIDKTSNKCSSLLSKIDPLSRNLKVKAKEVPVQKVSFPPSDEFLAFIDLTLSEIENSLKVDKPKEALINELLTIKATITHITEKQIREAKGNLIKQLLDLKDQVSLIKQSIKTLSDVQAIHSDLSSLREMLLEIDEIIKIENNMGRCIDTVFLEAWVPKNQLEELAEGIRKLTKEKCVIEKEPPCRGEEVPTVIKPVPRLLEAFEKLTFAIGYPRHGEVNPILITAITFPLLFGIMFADVGQGAILLIAGLILTYFRGKVDIKKVGEITRYFLIASGLLVLCGISSMSFGFLFGDFFGPSGVIEPILLISIGPFKIGGFDPLHEPLSMLRFAILVGVILLSLGLVLRVVNDVREKRQKPALISTCWLWLLLGGFFMWIYWGGISNFLAWFSEGSIMFFGLMGLPALLILVITASTRGIMEGVDFSIEVLLETLDHTISFSRLAALFLTHAALNHMFLMIAGVENGVFTLQSIPIIMLGTILALTIEGIIIFVHTLRLHWIELLPEFYSGKGIIFKPLKIK
jgi:V/A-type H+/Na+-transporting ATPase subunit I